LVSFYKNIFKFLWWYTGTFIAKLVYFFSTKAFLISAIITAKIIYLGFLASRASEVTPIIWMFRVLNKPSSSVVSYIGSSLTLGLISNLGLGSSSILFIVGYQFF